MICYNMCHVMLYNMCHVMFYNMYHVMLYNIKYVMLYNMLCYVMTSTFLFHFNAIMKILFFWLWVRNRKLHLFIKQIINVSVEETLII